MDVEKQTLFSSGTTYALSAVDGKKTIDCCAGDLWSTRDPDLDIWLEPYQLPTEACSVASLIPAREWTIPAVAACVLLMPADTRVEILDELLIERGYTTTLSQDEELAEQTRLGKKTGMVTDGYGNFSFKRNMDGKVSVSNICATNGTSDWNAFAFKLKSSKLWVPKRHRLIIPNFELALIGL